MAQKKFVTLFARIRGDIKLSADREEKVVNYPPRRIYDLIELLNALLKECNQLLGHAVDCSWVFVGESFDKPGIPVGRNRKPVSELLQHPAKPQHAFDLQHSAQSSFIQRKGRNCRACLAEPLTLPDTPVFRPDHSLHVEGRAAMKDILDKRMEEALPLKWDNRSD